MMEYALKTAQYEGPLEKLLELIEERKLAVSEISLAEVTDDFLKYLEQLPAVQPSLLADFLTIASRLVLIKSKSLLPEFPLTEEEEHDIKDLERRLELYRQLKATERHIAALWRSGHRAASRPYLFHASSLPPVFHPGSGLDPVSLAAAFARVYAAIEKITLETATVYETIVSLEEKMQEIAARMMIPFAALFFHRIVKPLAVIKASNPLIQRRSIVHKRIESFALGDYEIYNPRFFAHVR